MSTSKTASQSTAERMRPPQIAEIAFEHVRPGRWVRYGLTESNPICWNLPEFARGKPDYVMSSEVAPLSRLVECQGANHGILRLKKTKLENLLEWNEKCLTGLFAFDYANSRYLIVSVTTLAELAQDAPTGRFHEGNPYYKIDLSDREGWTDIDGATRQEIIEERNERNRTDTRDGGRDLRPATRAA